MAYEKISGFSDEISSDTTVQFETLKKLGIEYFEPRGIDGKNISELTLDEAKDLKNKMDSYGIKVSSIGSPIGKIKLSDDFESHFEVFKHICSVAKILGASYIRIFSFYHDGDVWTDEERSLVIERLSKFISYAKINSIVLLHENEKDIYGDNTERCKDLFDNLYCDNFKGVFDPANFVQCGVDTKDAFDTLHKFIEYVHIKDALAEGRVVPSGHGSGNVEYILEKLFKAGYGGYLSLEPHLGSFEGLSDLELGDEMENLPKSSEGTFIIAYNALCEILKNIGIE